MPALASMARISSRRGHCDLGLAAIENWRSEAQIADQHDLSLSSGVFGAFAYYYERTIGEVDAEIEYQRYLKKNREAKLVHK